VIGSVKVAAALRETLRDGLRLDVIGHSPRIARCECRPARDEIRRQASSRGLLQVHSRYQARPAIYFPRQPRSICLSNSLAAWLIGSFVSGPAISASS
jgi:hypothetical protein